MDEWETDQGFKGRRMQKQKEKEEGGRKSNKIGRETPPFRKFN